MDWQVPIYDGTTQRGVLTAQRGEHTGALAGMTLRKGINC